MKIRDILIGILLLLCTFLFLDRSCTSRKLDIARGKAENQKMATLKVGLKADKKIAELNSEKSTLVLKIESLENDVRKRDLKDVEKERRIEELEREEVVLVDSGEKDNIIVNLRKQVNNWKERFILTSSTIDDQKGIIFSLRAKYSIQVKITLEWEIKYNSEKKLRLVTEDLAERAIKEAAKIRFGSKLKTGGIALVGVVLLYAILK